MESAGDLSGNFGLFLNVMDTDLFRHIFRLVKDGIHGEDVAELQKTAVGQLPGLVKLAPLIATLKYIQSWHLSYKACHESSH